MHALTVAEAADIALAGYYDAPNLDLLPWNQITASVMDMGWGAGPAQAIKLLQRMVGASDDGVISSATGETAKKYAAYLGPATEPYLVTAAREYAVARNAFYDQIIAEHPANARFRNGWRARTASFLPGTAWWANWERAAA